MPPGGSENLSRKKIIQEASTMNPMGLKNTQPNVDLTSLNPLELIRPVKINLKQLLFLHLN